MSFHISQNPKPAGDQPQAIQELVLGFKKKNRFQTLLGVTGSGKTLSMAHTISALGKPTLIISHNKTLAAQLYEEFSTIFPQDHVHYFVSYYDYYQPEAYMPASDTYIEKSVQINEEIDRLRHAAVRSVLQYPNTIVIASVSCIYNLGSPQSYKNLSFSLQIGDVLSKRDFLKALLTLQFERNEIGFWRGNFRIRDRYIDVWMPEGDTILRVALKENIIEELILMQAPFGDSEAITSFTLFPAKFWSSEESSRKKAIERIQKDLAGQVSVLEKAKKNLEAERLRRRTRYDIALIEEVGWCKGIENYSRYFEDRKEGSAPYTLIDYFPHTESGEADFLTIIDESHITIPQIRGMHNGDRARKTTLVEHGFRLPSAIDNRPLTFKEFLEKTGQTLFASATPTPYELQKSSLVAEQIVRPTFLLDPVVEVRPTKNQIPNLLSEIEKRVAKNQRVLVTVLTKRLAEALSEHLKDKKIKTTYLHSEIDTLERPKILFDLRKGTYDVLVGVNLLREGLDLPEVSLVVILDADKEGFLRDRTSFIQIAGRAARHIDGFVIMYSDKITKSMKEALLEVGRRRKTQEAYNTKHHTKPVSIAKELKITLQSAQKEEDLPVRSEFEKTYRNELKRQLELAQRNLQFEKAAQIKAKIDSLKTDKKK